MKVFKCHSYGTNATMVSVRCLGRSHQQLYHRIATLQYANSAKTGMDEFDVNGGYCVHHVETKVEEKVRFPLVP